MKKESLYWGSGAVGLCALLIFYLSHSQFAQQYHLSALTLAIVIGIAIGNSFYPRVAVHFAQGVLFAKGSLLRLAIVLYGFRLTTQDINCVGANAIVTDALMLVSTFALAVFIGVRYLKLEPTTVYLTAGGCSICGAAAVMAMEPVTKAESHQISIAVAVVVLFGSLSMLLYPLAYPYLQQWLSPHQFGIYIGSTVHEVAQVYAAGGNISPAVADAAVITKMIRVMMLAPFLLLLSWLLAKNEPQHNKINIPWFAFGFIAMILLNSILDLPATAVDFLRVFDDLLLIAAMFALGLTTHFSAIKNAGLKPLILGGLIYLWLTVGGFWVNVAAQQSL